VFPPLFLCLHRGLSWLYEWTSSASSLPVPGINHHGIDNNAAVNNDAVQYDTNDHTAPEYYKAYTAPEHYKATDYNDDDNPNNPTNDDDNPNNPTNDHDLPCSM